MKKCTFFLFLVFGLFSYTYSQRVATLKLKLKPGESYQFECASTGKMYYWNAIQYPHESRVWYSITITDKANDSLFKCRVTISRIFEYKQTPSGYEVYDSKYPTSNERTDYRAKLLGYAYQGTLSSKGGFSMDVSDLKKAKNFSDETWFNLPASVKRGKIQYSYFKSQVQDILFNRLHLLQLFYPPGRINEWKPNTLNIEADPTSDIKHVFNRANRLTLVPQSANFSLIKLNYKNKEDSVFLNHRNGSLSGKIHLSRLSRELRFSFCKTPVQNATVNLSYDPKRKFSFGEKAMLEQIVNFKEVYAGKGVLTPAVDRPCIVPESVTGACLYLEPGETISLISSPGLPIQFSGPIAEENRYLNKFITEHPFFNQNYEYDEYLNNPKRLIKSIKDTLFKVHKALKMNQQIINPQLYSLLHDAYKYSAASYYLRYLNYTHASLEIANSDGIITGDMLYNTELMNFYASEYGRFISDYFQNLYNYGRSTKGLNVSGDTEDSDLFELNFIQYAVGSYPNYILTANKLLREASSLEKSNENYKSTSEEFLNTYDGDLFTRFLKFYYAIKTSMAPGEVFPPFIATTAENTKVSLKDLKGTKVMLHFVNEYGESEKDFASTIDTLNKLHDKYKEIRFIYIYQGPRGDNWNKMSKKFPKGIHGWTMKEDDIELIKLQEKLRLGRLETTHFLIDEKGAIYKNIVLPSGSFSERGWVINEYLKPELQKFSNQTTSFFNPHLKRWGLLGLIILALTAGLSYVIIRWRLKKIQLRESERRRVAEIELKAIRAQLNPHFIFNTMNSILYLINTDKKDRAAEYLSNLSVMMRAVLNNSESGTISLAEEIKFIKRYVLLEQLRFPFEYTINISSKIDTNTTTVPAMFLQPYVENAIIHGTSIKGSDGMLIINIEEDANHILYTIEDNGPGFDSAGRMNEKSMGLKLMQEKLSLIYRKDFSVSFSTRGTYLAGACVEIKLPPFI